MIVPATNLKVPLGAVTVSPSVNLSSSTGIKYILSLLPPIATILALAPDASPVTTSSVPRVPTKLTNPTLGIVLSTPALVPLASYIAFILNTSPQPSDILGSSTLYPNPSPAAFSCVNPFALRLATLLSSFRTFIFSVILPLAVLFDALTVAMTS